MYHQVSLYAFNLSQWTSTHGKEGYLRMLNTLAELAQAEKLMLFTRTVNRQVENGAHPRPLASEKAWGWPRQS